MIYHFRISVNLAGKQCMRFIESVPWRYWCRDIWCEWNISSFSIRVMLRAFGDTSLIPKLSVTYTWIFLDFRCNNSRSFLTRCRFDDNFLPCLRMYLCRINNWQNSIDILFHFSSIHIGPSWTLTLVSVYRIFGTTSLKRGIKIFQLVLFRNPLERTDNSTSIFSWIIRRVAAQSRCRGPNGRLATVILFRWIVNDQSRCCCRFLVPGWRMGWIIIHDRENVLDKEVSSNGTMRTTGIYTSTCQGNSLKIIASSLILFL